VAIVTGASQGIGAGIAHGLLGLGHRVVATSRSISPSDAADVHTVEGDISQAETAQRIVHETLDRFGRIDTLINNAGIFIGKPFLEYTNDDFAAMTAVNLDGFFAVAPGVVNTRTTASADYEEVAAQHPLGRMAEISDIVQGVIYLEQATFVTGETLHIDGGQAAGH